MRSYPLEEQFYKGQVVTNAGENGEKGEPFPCWWEGKWCLHCAPKSSRSLYAVTKQFRNFSPRSTFFKASYFPQPQTLITQYKTLPLQNVRRCLHLHPVLGGHLLKVLQLNTHCRASLSTWYGQGLGPIRLHML